MIKGHEVTEIINVPTFCQRSTNKGGFSTDMRGCICIRSVSNTIFAMVFLMKLTQTTWRTTADHQWSVDHSLRNTDLMPIES
jgi:hypothetical protein